MIPGPVVGGALKGAFGQRGLFWLYAAIGITVQALTCLNPGETRQAVCARVMYAPALPVFLCIAFAIPGGSTGSVTVGFPVDSAAVV